MVTFQLVGFEIVLLFSFVFSFVFGTQGGCLTVQSRLPETQTPPASTSCMPGSQPCTTMTDILIIYLYLGLGL